MRSFCGGARGVERREEGVRRRGNEQEVGKEAKRRFVKGKCEMRMGTEAEEDPGRPGDRWGRRRTGTGGTKRLRTGNRFGGAGGPDNSGLKRLARPSRAIMGRE